METGTQYLIHVLDCKRLFGVDTYKSVHDRHMEEVNFWEDRKMLNEELLSRVNRENLTLDRHTGLYHVNWKR